jgi:guanine deaminase
MPVQSGRGAWAAAATSRAFAGTTDELLGADRPRPSENLHAMGCGVGMKESYMRRALQLAVDNVYAGRGGPFAALIVRGGQIVGDGTSLVTSTNDPTAHAEVVAIRKACAHLGAFQLDECDLYTTCEPCPMCLGAIYWARPSRVFYAATQHEAAEVGFDAVFIYEQIALSIADRQIPMRRMDCEERRAPFDAWRSFERRIEY